MTKFGESWRRAVRQHSAGVQAIIFSCTFVVLAIPWLRRMRHPNIIGDDVQRMIDLQTLSLTERMFRPFNEHLAPLFELFTAAVWQCAGHRLARAPLAFTLASYVPFALSLVLLWVLARREWGSRTVAGFAVIVLAATPVYAECVFWFSASTFCWAMLFTLAALWMAGLARDRGSAWYWLGSAVASLLAPMGSAIGLLAGPAATVRAWPARRPSRPFRSEAMALIPAVGTLANLIMASFFRYQDVLAKSVRTTHDVSRGLGQVVQAPLYLVLSGYFRVREAHHVVPYAVSAAFFAASLVLIAAKIVRSHAADRRWLTIGVFFVGVGYSLIYCFRTWLVGVDSMLTIQRYHLFPCLGVVLVLTAWLAPRLRRLDARPFAGPAALFALALVLMSVNRQGMSDNSGYFRMQPDQRPVLTMMDHVSVAARSHDLSRDQVLRAFEPLEPRWTLAGWNALRMLPRNPASSSSPLDDAQVRKAILDALTPQERWWLLADRNVTHSLRPVASQGHSSGELPGEFVGSLRLHPLDRPEHYRSDGWPSYLEFRFPPGDPSPKSLSLHGLPPGKTLELWWAEGADEWSHRRRVVIRIDQPEASRRSDWVLPLDLIPQGESGNLRRLRITVREPGPVAIGPPALLR